MKSRVKRYTKKEMEWLCEEAMEQIETCIDSNGMVFIIALSRYLGWKEKRLNRFIEYLNEVMDEFHQHTVDGVIDIKLREGLEEAGLDYDTVMPKRIPFMQQLRKSRLEYQPDVSMAEAKKLHSEMTGFHSYMEDKKHGLP